MRKEIRKFSAAFKTKVDFEAIKEKETLQQLASIFEVHADQITQWKRVLLESTEDIFSKKKSEEKVHDEQEKDALYNKIGRSQTEIDFLKKSLEQMSLDKKRHLVHHKVLH
jgi:transposase